MATNPTRIPDQTYREVSTAARLLGCTPGDLLSRAWESYQMTPEFREDFTTAQKALEVGDLDFLSRHLQDRAKQRAAARAQAVRDLRS
jgi:hypothetical protein